MVAILEIISNEMIKPSSPTPHHLRTLQLSFLDQVAPPVYIPLIFFYQANQSDTFQDHAQISQLLKKSLSNVLTLFYPLAGRISSQNFSIDCNDAGALYVEAHVHSNLLQVIENPSMEEMKKYLPLDPNGRVPGMTEANTIILALQFNFFDCGGIAIGVQISHKIADGMSLVTFMNAWAASCRGDAETVPSSGFDSASLFPPREMSSFGSEEIIDLPKEKFTTIRLVFDVEKLEKLKHAAASAPGSQVKDPTRVEAVSAFLWRQFIEASNAKMDSNSKKMAAALHLVNLRPTMDPALPDHAIGNLWTGNPALLQAEGEKDYHNLVGHLRSAINNIDSNYVKKLQNGDDYLYSYQKLMELVSIGEVEFCCFSSWCRFPVYKVDYGWGKPTWVSTANFHMNNVAMLMSTSCGLGIEAWINLLEEDLPTFQSSYLHL